MAWAMTLAVLLVLMAAGPAAAAAESTALDEAVGVEESWTEYESDDVTVRSLVFIPKRDGRYPGIYYIFGRPGLDGRLKGELRRLAARGFAVYVAEWQQPRMIPVMIPTADPPEVRGDIERGFDHFLQYFGSHPKVRLDKACIVGTVRGAYYAFLLAAHRREVACLVAYHAVIMDHALPEAAQHTQYLPDVQELKVPVLMMVGDKDFEVRQAQSLRVAEYLKEKGRPLEFVVYPGAQRAFDFRIVNRTVADEMARLDSMNRTVRFLNKHLGAEGHVASCE